MIALAIDIHFDTPHIRLVHGRRHTTFLNLTTMFVGFILVELLEEMRSLNAY